MKYFYILTIHLCNVKTTVTGIATGNDEEKIFKAILLKKNIAKPLRSQKNT
jgi:hypothetical protein